MARRLTDKDAMDTVAGFTVPNDIGAREVVVHERMQVMLSKSPGTFVPTGPAIVMKEDLPGLDGLRIASCLTGELLQAAPGR
jgi:2-keto-4-pentenoate hydratase/2-oxohepta-3-ene-1,7-dioic acid hydratase in catechol pathway